MQRWIDIGGAKIPIDTEAEREVAFAAMRTAGIRAALVRTTEEPDGRIKNTEYLWLPELAETEGLALEADPESDGLRLRPRRP